MRIVTSLLLFISLSSCGVAYHSPNVTAGISDEAKVRVLPITAENVMLANRSSYTPQALPAAFQQVAGGAGAARGIGATPELAYTAQTRPRALELRIPPEISPQPYEIGIGDVVLLATPSGTTVEELAGLLAAQNSRQGYTVQSDGMIAIPNVGRVSIAGMSVEGAEDTLFQRLVEAQIDPTFSLEITGFNSKKVSVGGAVSRPGVAPITLTPLYLDEALATAGGTTVTDIDYASARLYRDGTLYQIPLTELYGGSGLNRIALKDGDSVFVDTAFELEQASAYFSQQIQLANFKQSARKNALDALTTEVALRRASLAEVRGNFHEQIALDAIDRDYVYLTGEVSKQGRFTLPLGRTANLSDALFEGAGGLSLTTSDPRHIYVLRGSQNPLEFDALTAWNLNARNAASFMLATRFELRPNDVIFVTPQPVTKWHRVVNQISPSILNIGANAVSN